jgi:predicted ThiF/HesA family dinucleotide-utilizing enzyme
MDTETTELEPIERMKRFVKAELKRADVTYEELAHRLRGMGYGETKISVANKLGRGTFSATFFVAVMRAIGRENVNLAEL